MRLGCTELAIIIVLALLIFGGSKIGGLGKNLGKSVRDFKSEMREDKKESEATKIVEGEIVSEEKDAK